MATSDELSSELVLCTIVSPHNVVLRIPVPPTRGKGRSQQEEEPTTIHVFHASREILTSYKYFKRLLAGWAAEAKQDEVTLNELDPAAVKLLLQILHGTSDGESYNTGLDNIWYMLDVAKALMIEPDELTSAGAKSGLQLGMRSETCQHSHTTATACSSFRVIGSTTPPDSPRTQSTYVHRQWPHHREETSRHLQSCSQTASGRNPLRHPPLCVQYCNY